MISNMSGIEDRPENLNGKTIQVETGCGNMYVTLNTKENYPIFEVFCVSNKTGSCASAVVDALNRIISLSLRAQIHPRTIIEQLQNIKCDKSITGNTSCPEAVANAMEDYLNDNFVEIDIDNIEKEMDNYKDERNIDMNINVNSNLEKCPECESEQYNPSVGGCDLCPDCGYSSCA